VCLASLVRASLALASAISNCEIVCVFSHPKSAPARYTACNRAG
jgi:hypothetical protein